MATTRVIILGAAGRDFHNFNVVYRDDPAAEVVAFTAAQIPGIAGRRSPRQLAGPRYPAGIPREPVIPRPSRALASGADFVLLGGRRTMLPSAKPVVAVCAVRTGCGKGAVSRRVVEILRARGRRVAVVRHPMPYGDLLAQRVPRFPTFGGLDTAGATLEEREEYEPHLEAGGGGLAGAGQRRGPPLA